METPDVKPVPMRLCTKCRRSKPATTEYFHSHRDSRRKFLRIALQSQCIECKLIYAARWRKRQKEALAEVAALECDCGAPKPALQVGCDPCMELDGHGAIGAIVSALRALGGHATFDALVDQMGIATRNVYRAIAHAKQVGRVKQIHQHDDVSGFSDERATQCVRAMRDDSDRYRQSGKSATGRALQAPALFILIDKVAA